MTARDALAAGVFLAGAISLAFAYRAVDRATRMLDSSKLELEKARRYLLRAIAAEQRMVNRARPGAPACKHGFSLDAMCPLCEHTESVQ